MRKHLTIFLLFLSTLSFAQSETHDFITYDTLFNTGVAGTTFRLRVTRPRHMFTAGNADTASRPALIHMGGAGEVGTNYALLRSYGPHYWLYRRSNLAIDSTLGWDGKIVTGSGTHYPILISVQYSQANPRTREILQILNHILNTYHIKRNSVHLAGLSMGGFSWTALINHQTTAGDETGMKLVRSILACHGVSNGVGGGLIVAPDVAYASGMQAFGHWAKKYGGKFMGFEGYSSDNFRNVWQPAHNMHDSLPGSSYFSYTSVGNPPGSHSGWNSIYSPYNTSWSSVAPLGTFNTGSQFGAGQNKMGTYKSGDNVFTWMFKQGDTTLVGGGDPPGNQSPTANAGSDQSITLPTSSVSLTGNGNDLDGTIASYAWTKQSGGSATITTASAQNTTVTGLSTGTYVFRLTVTDDDGATGTDDVTVTVSAAGTAKIVTKVVPSEYKISYLYNDGTLRAVTNGAMQAYNLGARTVVDAAGGFNNFAIIDDEGYMWQSSYNNTVPTRMTTDTLGNAFNDNLKVFGYYGNHISIRSDSSLWYWGEDKYNWFTGSNPIVKPIQICTLKVQKVVMGFYRVVILTTNGQVWEIARDAAPVAVQKTIPRAAVDIFGSHWSYAGCIIPKTTGSQTMGYPYVWGTSWGYWGGSAAFTQPTDISSLWGVTVPIKKIVASYNTTHYIDSLGRMFGIGDNVMGEIGNGVELVNRVELYSAPYSWTFANNEFLTGAPPQQIGAGTTWKNLWTDNTLTFYNYASDTNDSIYFWGRDKAYVGGRGYLNLQEQFSPNAMDVLTPTRVTPISIITQNYNFTPPTINAGADQSLSGVTSANLVGTATAPKLLSSGTLNNGQPDISPTISTYLWTKLSGPSCTITSADAASTSVTSMSTGTYVFKLLMTDSKTGTIADTVTVSIDATPPANEDPVSDAGDDISITLPTNTTNLDGTESSDDGSITALWTKIAGPEGVSIGTPNSLTTEVFNLEEGVYQFELLVTDNHGATDRDTVVVTVFPGIPTARAGNDQTITLPTTSTTLDGSASSNVGTFGAYSWSQVSGTAATINQPSSVGTIISDLAEGVYVFRLTVTNASGSATDDVTITVNLAANIDPTANAGTDQEITLPDDDVSLVGEGTDTDGTIASYAWTKLSGGAATITSPSSASTTVTGLEQGEYQFQLLVTDDRGGTATDIIVIRVLPEVLFPIARAGFDQQITLPTNAVTVSASASENAVSYLWEKISGTGGTITSPTSVSTTITGLTQGSYQFKVTVTNENGTDEDEVIIVVNPAPNIKNFYIKTGRRRFISN